MLDFFFEGLKGISEVTSTQKKYHNYKCNLNLPLCELSNLFNFESIFTCSEIALLVSSYNSNG